jgi:hypothetical protein
MNESIEKDYQAVKFSKLALAIGLDLVGMLTFLLPGLGEFGDLAWAPVAAIANLALFGGVAGAAGGAFTFVEEILPGTDFIPSVTLTWIYKYVVRDDASFEAYVAKRQHRKRIVESFK